MMQLPTWDVERVAEFAGMNIQSVRLAIREGRLRAYKIGKCWRMYDEDVDAFFRSRPSMKPKPPVGQIPQQGIRRRRRI